MSKRIILFFLVLSLGILLAACGGAAVTDSAGGGDDAASADARGGDSQLPVDVPRKDVFVADQIFRYSVVDNFNFWINGPHVPHRHALFMETLWIRDQETGELIMDVAISEPMYNDDFTQLNVDLRDTLYWSDGEHFTADDLVYTVELLKSNPDLNSSGWSSQLNQFLDSIEKTGD